MDEVLDIAPPQTDNGDPQSPPQGDPRKKLWQSLYSSKDYTKSYDEFTKQFSNPESIKKLHDAIASEGDYTKGFDSFQNQFFPTPKKKEVSGTVSQIGGQAGTSVPQSDENAPDQYGRTGFMKNLPAPLQLESKDPINDALVVARQKLHQASISEDPLDRLAKSKAATSEIKTLANGFNGNGNAAKPILDKIIGDDADKYSIDQLKQKASGNVTATKAVEALDDKRKADDAINTTTDFYKAANKRYSGKENEFQSDIPKATQGENVREFLSDPNVIQRAKTDPDFNQKYKEAKFNWMNDFPEAASKEVNQKIGQYMEDNGMANAIYNNPGKDKVDKAVDEMKKKGFIDEREEKLYQDKTRPDLGTLHSMLWGSPVPTADVINTFTKSLEKNGNDVMGGIRDVADKISIGTISGLGESDADRQKRILESEAETPQVEPKGEGKKTALGVANLAGFATPLILGELAGVPTMATMSAQFEGGNRKTAMDLYPEDKTKQDIYTILGTTLDLVAGQKLPIKGAGDVLKGLVSDVVDKKITQQAAKEQFNNFLIDAAKNTSSGANAMALMQVGHNGLEAALGGKDFKVGEQASKLLEQYPKDLLNMAFLGGVAAAHNFKANVEEQKPVNEATTQPTEAAPDQPNVESTQPVTTEEAKPTETAVDKIEPKSEKEVNLPTNEGQPENTSTQEDKGLSNRPQTSIEESPEKREQKISERLKNIHPEEITDPYDKVLNHFANGGKVNPSAVNELFGGAGKSIESQRRSMIGLIDKKGQSIDQLAHSLWEDDKTGKYDTSDYKDAIEKVLGNYNHPAQMAKDLVERYDWETAQEKYYNQKYGKEAIDAVDNMSDDEINHLLSLDATENKQQETEDYFDSISKPPDNTTPEVQQEQGEPTPVTSIQNSIVDKEREKRGLPPAIQAAKKEFGETWDNAMKKVEDDPTIGERLVSELKDKPRPLSDEENAVLLHRQITLQNAYEKVNKSITEASDKGDEAGVQENRLRLAGLSDALQDVYNVGKEAGTQNARGLATRQMLAKEDYSLASMETQKRAANKGRELTQDERAHIQTLHDRITELEAKVKDLQEQASLPKQPKTKTKKTDEDFKKERKEIFDSIKEKLRKSRGGTQATIIPYAKELIEISPDVAKLVKSLVEQGVTKLSEIVDHIHGQLKDDLPEGVSKNDIKDIVTGKYEQPKFSRIQSPEELKARAELERNKIKFKTELELDRKKTAGPLEKSLNTFIKWERAFKLSSPLTLAKLTMAGLYRTASTPIEETIGAGVKKVLPKAITSKAYREAGLNAKAEAKAITNQFTQGMKDAWATINFKKGGRSDLEALYGKEGKLPPEAADFLGHLHGALKAPIKRAEFERSFEKRMANMVANGIDVQEPLVQTAIALDAYKDANRSIFMQDNAVSTWWQRNVIGNPKSDLGKVRSAVAQFLVPFAKVPTNIVGETVNYIAGVPMGAYKLAEAYAKGIEKLSPEDADRVVRLFKKGSIGAGFLLLGYYNPQAIGGYYTGKRNDKDVAVGGLRLFGKDIPQWLVHNPLMEALQIGATVRRVSDAYVGNTDERNGMAKGIVEAGLGLVREVPFVNEAGQLQKLGNEQDRENFLGEMAKNSLVPAAVQFAAKYSDSDVKRKPETLGEHIKMGIPGLREQVHEKHSYSDQDLNKPAFKFFTDKGMSLPYTSERSIKIKDAKSGTIKKLSDFPKEKIDDFYNQHKKELETELEKIEKDKLYVNEYGDISTERGKGKSQVDINDLTRKQYAEVLSIANREATVKAKDKLFYKKH